MKKVVIILSVILLFVIICITPKLSTAKGGSGDSECINCHTDLKKLIHLCWEIEKTRSKAGKSAETSGEG